LAKHYTPQRTRLLKETCDKADLKLPHWEIEKDIKEKNDYHYYSWRRLLMKLKTTTVKQKIMLQALPDEVYDALLDSRIHSEFTGSKATGEAKVGAEFTAWDGYISGKNLELERGKRIVQEWVTTEWPSRLEFTLMKVDGKTELKMVHSDIPTDQEEGLKQGWTDYYWEPLKRYFEERRQKV